MKYIKKLEQVEIADVATVGGKNASLGEMLRALGEKGVNVPSGFEITARGYRYLVESAAITGKTFAHWDVKFRLRSCCRAILMSLCGPVRVPLRIRSD